MKLEEKHKEYAIMVNYKKMYQHVGWVERNMKKQTFITEKTSHFKRLERYKTPAKPNSPDTGSRWRGALGFTHVMVISGFWG